MSLYAVLLWWFVITGLASIVAWSAMQRRHLVGMAVINAVGTFAAYNVLMPAGMDIRVDLMLTIPMLVIIVVCSLVHWSRRQSDKRDQPPQT
ncbi:MAG TPA: hypothetical protein VHX44_09620 [Planctomycetota bacterium]|nr:hypothetical protein [Planctomycetota bacterium]